MFSHNTLNDQLSITIKRKKDKNNEQELGHHTRGAAICYYD